MAYLRLSIVRRFLFYLVDKDVNEIINDAKNEGILFEFDGKPIISAGTARFHCHQCADIDLVQKNRARGMKFRFNINLLSYIHSNDI